MATIIPLSNTPDSIHQEYTSEQEVLIPSILSSSLFNPSTDYMVFSLETVDGEFLYSTRNTRYAIRNVPNTITKETTSEVVTFPLEDIQNSEYSEGNYNVFYNFYKTALESDIYSFFIKEISPSRTEIRLSVNNVDDKKIQLLFNEFKTLLDEGTYFKDFYLNIGDYYYIAVNTQLDTSASPNTILFKTYQPLPSDISLNTQVQVVFETAETYGFNVDIPIVPIEFEDDIEYVRGPNFNLGIIDEVNNTTFEQDYTSLVNTPLTSSYNQIQNLLNQKGVTIDTDYTDFSNFIHFSSAEQRLLNFYYKVSLIESYNNDINLIQTITGSTSSSIAVTASIQNIQNQITDLIKNFDGYENFLYYTSGAYAYPKSNSTQPYTLYSTGSNETLTWLGSTNESSGFYGGILLSASLYDNENQDYLYNSVPKYIKEDPINAGYELFISMVGQHFDNLYIYINAITDRYDADNRVNYGIPKELVADALKSMGIKLYQNNFSSDDLYAAFLGINGSGSFLPPTGSEVITNYVTASNEPIPLNNLNLETYKRLYHNLPYLLKKKGTIEGLRTLINIFGIPDTILRISEFGGKDKDNTNDWDYFQNKFNYAFNSGSISTRWVVDSNWGTNNNKPESIFFRFKPTDLPTSSIEDTLLYISSSTPLYLKLSYTGSNLSGSYSGSIPSSSKEYATLTLLVSESEIISSSEYTPTSITPEYFSINGIEAYNNFTASIIESSSLIPPSFPLSSSLSAPFYNGDWWGVSITKNPSQYTLHVSNKIYDGNDGFKLGESISSSLNVLSVNNIGNDNLDLTPYLGIRRIITSSNPGSNASHLISLRYTSGSLFTFDLTQVKQIRFGAELDIFSPEDFPSIAPTSIPNTGSVLLYKKNDTSSYAKFSYSSSQAIGLIYEILGAAASNEADNLSTLVLTESSSNTPFSNGDEIMAVLYSGSSITPDISWYSSSYISSSLTTHSLSVSGSWTSSFNNTISWDSGSLLTLYSSNSLLQELRYYNITQSEAVFHDYVMNPYSIEGTNYSSSANNLIFRAPLGSDLITTTGSRISIHPKVTGSYITKSFVINSNYTLGGEFIPNTEFIYYDQPAVGIKNRISEKIRIEDNILPSGNVLTPYKTLQQRFPQSESYTRDVNYVEVAFSPQNEINDDINSSMGYFNIGEYIGDPRQVSESTYSYPDLDKLRDSYFDKYYKNYNWNDYIRLIKYFDNSLFKMIKDFTPARSGLATGVVIKQHLLERNRQRPAQVEISQYDYSGSVYSQQMWDPIISGTYISNSRISKIEGGAGGAFNDVNNLGSNPEGQSQGIKNTLAPFVTQSWTYEIQTLSGSLIVTQSTQDEFYNGELQGTEIEITNGELGIILDTSLENSIIAYYGQVYKYLDFDTKPGNINRMTYITDSDGRNSNIIGFLFVNEASDIDENSVDLAPYLSLLKSGDILQLRTSEDNQIYEYTIISSTPYDYLGFSGHQVIIIPQKATGKWDNLGVGFKAFSVEWIYDPTIIDIQKAFKDNEPLQNNATTPQYSTIYQDIDYSTGLVPTNFGLLVSGNADYAPVQDSNYTATGWANSRYKGSRVSSTDFNV
jgi:hypothetical protein